MKRIENVDDLCEYTGQIGVYQACVLVIVFCLNVYCLDSLTMIFVGADMPHWCRIDQLANLSFTQQKNIAIPYSQPGLTEYSSCTMYNLNFSVYSDEELKDWNRTLMVNENTPVVECKHWTYDQSTFVSTIVSRFDLVCRKELLVEIVSNIYMTGQMIGSLASGIVADRSGRMKAGVIFLSIEMVGIVGSTFAPSYVFFVIARFILGFGSVGVYTTSYVFLLESIGPSYRAFIGGALQTASSVGFIMLPMIALSIRDEIRFQIVAMWPIAMFFAMPLIVNESLRWLIVKQRYDEAYKVLKHICDVNGSSFPVDIELTVVENNVKSASCLILLTSPRLRIHTIIVHIMLFVSALQWFALSLNTGNLPGDIFVNTAISASLEIPSIIVIVLLLNVKALGRRLNCSATFMLTGLGCLLCIPMKLLNFESAVTGIAICAKAVATCTYTVVFIYSSEIFPTEVRNSAMGSGMMAASVGSIISPYFGAPMSEIWGPLPYVLLGSFAVVAGVLVLFLPETLGQPLPDTVQQAEANTKKRSKKEDSVGLENTARVVDLPTTMENDPQGIEHRF